MICIETIIYEVGNNYKIWMLHNYSSIFVVLINILPIFYYCPTNPPYLRPILFYFLILYLINLFRYKSIKKKLTINF